jgi:glutaminase
LAVARALETIHAKIAAEPLTGQVAHYIPELSKADPHAFGIALVTADGHEYFTGDVDAPFTIQSISKPFVYGLVLEALGVDATLRKIGVEPSGEAFNSISLDPGTGRPFNPMINAGAIAASALFHSLHGEATAQVLRDRFGAFSGTQLEVDDAVYRSERATGHRNRAIAHLLRNFSILEGDVDRALDVYFAQCALRVSCRELAMMGATLANQGRNPRTQQRALPAECVRHVLSVMASCGVYDYSGEWSFRVGLPAKSGVGGGMLAILPGRLALAVYAPPLDARGNSARGVRVCEEFAQHFRLHMLEVPRVGQDAIRKDQSGIELRSRRARRHARQALLDTHGSRIRVLQLQGELSFSAAELVCRRVEKQPAATSHLTIDLRRVTHVDAAAIGLLVSLGESFTRAGKCLIWSRARHLPALFEALAALPPGSSLADDAGVALERCEDALLRELESLPTMQVELASEELELARGLSAHELAALSRHSARKAYAQGEVLVREGDPATHLYFVLIGRAAVELAAPGAQTHVVAHIDPGFSFGEMALIERQPRSATVRASQPTICLEVAFAALERPELREVRNKLLANLAADLSQRLRRANAEIQALL